MMEKSHGQEIQTRNSIQERLQALNFNCIAVVSLKGIKFCLKITFSKNRHKGYRIELVKKYA